MNDYCECDIKTFNSLTADNDEFRLKDNFSSLRAYGFNLILEFYSEILEHQTIYVDLMLCLHFTYSFILK